MKFNDYDISLLVKECTEFLYYIDENEIDNDCYTEEQIFINAVSNMMLALNLMIKEKMIKE